LAVANDSNNNNEEDADTPIIMEWQDLDGGCKLLIPPTTTTTTAPAPKAIIHFLGGAFVSPQPTVAYRYILEQLSQRGYAIIATPFAVDFDYRKPAADIYHKFSLACRDLDDEASTEAEAEASTSTASSDKLKIENFRSLPLLAMGHSLGALMQVLLACEYSNNNNDPNDQRTAVGTALISYNNKNVDGAIPAFKELFVPALQPFEPLTRDPKITDAFLRVQEVRRNGFDSLRTATQGIQAALGLKDGESLLPGVRPLVLKAINDVEAASELVDQIPGVVASIAKGVSEFEPTPEEMKIIVAESYNQQQQQLEATTTTTVPAPPLIVKFSDDSIDESDELAAILPESLDVKRATLSGTHVTPLAIDPNAESTPLLSIPDILANGPVGDLRQELLMNADALVDTLDDYFIESIERATATAAPTTATTATATATATATPEEVKETTAVIDSAVLDPITTTPSPTAGTATAASTTTDDDNTVVTTPMEDSASVVVEDETEGEMNNDSQTDDE